MSRIIFAIDPGSGYLDERGNRKNSATGICIFDPNSYKILLAKEIRTMGRQTTWERTRDLARMVRREMQKAVDIYGPLEIRIENFVMKGAAAEVLYRLVGAYIGSIPDKCTFAEIHNITLKKDLTGDGKADKKAIAEGLLQRFKNDADMLDILTNLMYDKNEDALDAIAIAVCREILK